MYLWTSYWVLYIGLCPTLLNMSVEALWLESRIFLSTVG